MSRLCTSGGKPIAKREYEMCFILSLNNSITACKETKPLIEDVLVNNDDGQSGEQEWNASVLNKTKPNRTATKVKNALIYLFKHVLADMYEMSSHGIVKELSEREKKEETIKIKYGLNIIIYVNT